MRRSSVRSHLTVLLAAIITAVSSSEVAAQDPTPAPLPTPPMTVFVVDARGGRAWLSQDATVATALGVQPNDLPSRGWGFVVGAHVYPIRAKKFAVGFGAEMLRIGGSNTVEAETEDGIDGPTVKTKWSHLSPQVSFNFGARDGWSYLTLGLGRSKLTMENEDEPQDDPESAVGTLNYGGGARWFMNKHLAFTVDLRFYSINAQEATTGRIATPKMRLRVFTAGFSIR
jgi:hypothetical protein